MRGVDRSTNFELRLGKTAECVMGLGLECTDCIGLVEERMYTTTLFDGRGSSSDRHPFACFSASRLRTPICHNLNALTACDEITHIDEPG